MATTFWMNASGSTTKVLDISGALTKSSFESDISFNKMYRIYVGTNVTSIKDDAIMGASRLEIVTIPNTVTDISDNTFIYTNSLRTVDIDSNNVHYSSRDNINAANKFVYDASLSTLISCMSASNTNNDTRDYIKIPASVTRIKTNAFWNSTGHQKVLVFPTDSSIQYIEDGAFTITDAHCYGKYNSIYDFVNGIYAPANKHHLFSQDSFVLNNHQLPTIFDYTNSATDLSGGGKVLIPSGSTDISFNGCTNLKSVFFQQDLDKTISNLSNYEASLNVITDNAFIDCSGLQYIDISPSITSIGNNAFTNCTSLTSISIPYDVTNIGFNAFLNSGLTSAIIFDDRLNKGYNNFPEDLGPFQTIGGKSNVTINNNWKQKGDYIKGFAHYYRYGKSVAISDDGLIVASIGSREKNTDGNSAGSGENKTYDYMQAFRYNDISWVQFGNIITTTNTNDDYMSVSLSADGSIVAFGAPTMSNPANGFGFVNMYQYNDSSNSWVQIGEDASGNSITNSDSTEGRFGWAVSLSKNGKRVAVGDPYYYQNVTRRGNAYVYQYNDISWVRLGDPFYGDQDVSGEYGHSVCLNGDGSRVAIGGYNISTGIVDVFEYNDASWVQIGQRISKNNSPGFLGDNFDTTKRFGWAVSLSADGNILAVGDNGSSRVDIQPDGSTDGGFESGTVTVFKYNNGNGTWGKIGQRIYARDSGELLGSSVSLSSDGSILSIGVTNSEYSYENIYKSRGHIIMYKYNNVTDKWVQIGDLIRGPNRPSDLLYAHKMGASVAITRKNSKLTLVSGATNTDEDITDANDNERGLLAIYDYTLDDDLNDTIFYKDASSSEIISIYGELNAKHYPYSYIPNNINRVVIGYGITDISANTFNDCSNITSLTIPSSVTNIGANAFAGTANLKTIYIRDASNSLVADTSYNIPISFYGNNDVILRAAKTPLIGNGWYPFGNMTTQSWSEAKIDWGLDGYELYHLIYHLQSENTLIADGVDLNLNEWTRINLNDNPNPTLNPYTTYWVQIITRF